MSASESDGRITSRRNPLVRSLRELHEARGRREQGLLLLEMEVLLLLHRGGGSGGGGSSCCHGRKGSRVSRPVGRHLLLLLHCH